MYCLEAGSAINLSTVLLKEKILDTGKKFLHIHGGYLPDYKGSTTNYYSLINENTIGASAIFLTLLMYNGLKSLALFMLYSIMARKPRDPAKCNGCELIGSPLWALRL